LYNAYPEGIREADSKLGYLPLHYACIGRAPLVVIQYLHRIYPRGFKKKTKDGLLPIHIACEKGASLEIVTFMHQVNPNGVKTRDNNGRLPIHSACLYRAATLPVIRFLCSIYLEGVSTKDKSSQLPLDVASVSGASQDVIDYLGRSKDNNPAEEGKLCVICFDGEKTHAFIPCGHFCVCENCAERLKDNGDCPVCRAKIVQVNKIFFSF